MLIKKLGNYLNLFSQVSTETITGTLGHLKLNLFGTEQAPDILTKATERRLAEAKEVEMRRAAQVYFGDLLY